MNTETGEVKNFKTDEEAKAAGFTEKLTKEEARKILDVESEEDRRLELLWLQCWRTQRLHYRPDKEKAMRHAFLLGCKTMLMIAANMKEKDESYETER